MAHTQYRNPIRPARGTKAALDANTDRLELWEFVFATDENRVYVWNGTALIEAGVVELNLMSNVDAANIVDGSILVWNNTQQKWIADVNTTTEELVNGGNF